MAKLNITFVNEVGNNLNRYKAIDVNTGEEYLFDLSRNGTITIPGTPLNAEIMNAIVSAINEQFSNIVVAINDTTPSDTKYPSEKAVVDYVGQIANEKSVNVSDNVLIKISGVSDNLALPPESQMEVNSIEGNSVVVNQIIKNGNFADTSEDWYNSNVSKTIANNTITFTLNQDVGGVSIYVVNDYNPTPGHKFLMSYKAKVSRVGIDLGYGIGGTYRTSQFLPTDTNWHVYCQIDTFTSNDVYKYLYIGNCLTGDEIQFRDYHVIDLTQWFGSNDNIPQDILNTPSNFFKHYKGSLAYDTGHIENGSGNLVDTNRNIWDEEWVVSGNGIHSLNKILVTPNTQYYFCNKGIDVYISINYYDNENNFITSSPTNTIHNGVIFTTPINCYSILFWVDGAYGTTYNHDICINVSDTNFNGTYVEHIKNTLDFGNDTLRSAGNARDKKIPDGEITRKVGSVDLGTLDWVYTNIEGHKYFHENIVDIVVGQSTGIPNIICSKYVADTDDNVYKNINDKTISIMNKQQRIFIYDSTYTDVAAFKAAMSGVILNYELATPTIEQGTPYDNYIPVYYGGQEYLTGDVPFVINNYDISIKDQVLTNVRVDKEQSKQIHALENVNREQSNAIDSLQNEVSNLKTTQEAHSTSINSLTTKVTDLENYKFDSSKLKIEQNLVNTILKYNNVEIDRIENLDVVYLPNIVFDVYQDSPSTAQEKVTITNSTNMDMYVSIKGLQEHNNLFVPFGESVTSQLTISSSLPSSYIATIEIKIYYNRKEKYNATIGYTVFENVKTINLRATVNTTDR